MPLLLEEVTSSFSGDDNLITLEMEATGSLNNHEIRGTMFGAYSPEANEFRGAMDFADVADLGNMLTTLSSCSVICVNCCIGSRPMLGASNLMSLFDKSYSVDAKYAVVSGDFERKLVDARLMTSAEIARVDSGTRIHGTVDVSGGGEYIDLNPDNALRHGPGYAVLLRQVAPREVEGVLAYPLYPVEPVDEARASARVLSSRTYHYDTDLELPFPEVQNYSLRDLRIDVRNGRRTVRFATSAYYAPLASVPTVEMNAVGASPGI